MLRILREDSTFRARRNLAALVLVVIGCLLVPYQFAFQHRVHLIGSIIIYLIDVFFLIDIVFSFRTTYRHQGVDVTDPKLIASHYRRGRLPVDLSLLLGERRTASAKALTYCDLLVLPKREFERIKHDYDEFRQALKALFSERSEKISALVLSGAVL